MEKIKKRDQYLTPEDNKDSVLGVLVIKTDL